MGAYQVGGERGTRSGGTTFAATTRLSPPDLVPLRIARGPDKKYARKKGKIGGLPTRKVCAMLEHGSFCDFVYFLERRRSMTAQVFVTTACSRLPLVC